MPGDPHKKVLPGQKLEVPAEAFNSFIEAARYVRARQHGTQSEAGAEVRQTGIVKVRNKTGADRDRFNVLALDKPIIGPTDNLEELKSKLNFDGIVPPDPVKPGRFAVLLEPLRQDAIGRGVVAGVTLVRLQVDPDHLYDYAEVEANSTSRLRNVPHGSARVLWVEDGNEAERWAIVRLDEGDHEAHVFITSNSPDADGYYPGVVQRYDVATKAWQDLYPCKVLDVNG